LISDGAIRVIVIIFASVIPGITEAKSPHLRPFKAHTHFLATSTCIRGTWGLNRDVYLAEIMPDKQSEILLVRLIDEYRNLDPPLSVDTLTSATGTTMKIRRDAQCDIPYVQMQLRTAPGDPMAILHERLRYQPQLGRTPAPTDIIPCYRNIR
jgi:hypothetical protein